MAPMAFVPTVLMAADRMLTPHAMAAISTRVNILPWPTSANEARYSATLIATFSSEFSGTYRSTYLRLPDVPVNTMAML